MFTAIGIIVIVALLAALAAAGRRFPALWRPARALAQVGGRALCATAGVVSRAADMLLAGRDNAGSWWRADLFTVVAALPLLGALAMPHSPALAGLVDPGGLLVVGLVCNLLILLAAAFVVREDYDVMDGIVAETRRRFRGARSVAWPSTVIVVVALIVVYVAAAAWWLAAVHGVALVAGLPWSSASPATYLLIALRALPSEPLLSLLDRLTGDDTGVIFGPSPVAGLYFLFVRIMGLSIVLGLILVAVERRRQLRRYLAEIEESDVYRPELIARGRRAPRAIVRGVLNAAVTPGDRGRQERLIAAAVEMGLRDLPVLLCARLSEFPPELQVSSLDRAIEMFRYRTREFTASESVAILAAAAPTFAHGRLDLEPTKRLARLMASVIIFKKDSIAIPDRLRKEIMTALQVELAKPRVSDEAALRGILRDLQSALGGQPIVVRPIVPSERSPEEWIRQVTMPPADRAARPETPSTTVH